MCRSKLAKRKLWSGCHRPTIEHNLAEILDLFTIRVHFAPAATGNTISGYHFIELDSDEDSISMSVRLTNLYISNASGADNLEYRVIAELTPINTDNNPDLGTVGISE